MNEAAYLRAALGNTAEPPVRILGQELEDYSLAHEMLLRQQRNVFLLPPDELSQVDPDGSKILNHLFLGVYVCCHSYPEVREALRRPDLQRVGRRWRARAKAAGVNNPTEVRRFKCYVLAGQYCPPFEPVKQRHRKQFNPGAPWLLLLLKTLIGPLNFSYEAALNLSYAHAQFLYLSYWESQGTVRLLTNEDESRVHKAAAAEGLQVMRFRPGQLETIQQEDASASATAPDSAAGAPGETPNEEPSPFVQEIDDARDLLGGGK